jgi:hypothetical protein
MFALTCFPPRWESASSATSSRPGCRVRAVALACRAEQRPAHPPAQNPKMVSVRSHVGPDVTLTSPGTGSVIDILA